MATRALILALLILAAPATAEEFQINPPENIATMTMPCWPRRQLSEALTLAKFEPVVRGLLVAKTDVTQPLTVVWMHLISGRAAITISHPSGEECMTAVLSAAE
jgi:hypothetical protein